MFRSVFCLSAFLVLPACRNDPGKIDTANPSGECTWYTDADADGYGDVGLTAVGPCDEVPSGYVDNDLDCDDDDAAVNPDADELCNGVDDDCDGSADEDAIDATTWYLDADADGYGDAAGAVTACDAPDGFVDNDLDCDDDDPETHPDAAERCDGLDNDCDGEIDEDLQEVWYADADGDGFGNAESALESCDPGDGWVADDTDCDDANSSVFPGAEELCNDTDDDCDGEIDEGLAETWYQDADSDGFGDPELATEACEPGTGWVDNAEDCDDANSGIHPDAQEECNGYDDDCDGLIDDQDDSVTGLETWYLDADGDGYGDDASTTEACDLPGGYAEYGGDCDDGDATYNPGASEDDCTDPADYNCDGSTGYTDDDGDGYAACEDCDDSDASISPDGEEICDNLDNDCDGDIDEDDATDAATWYLDADGDGYGDASSTTAACDQPSGYVGLAYATDCDDADAGISPVAAESCDEIDNDCDGDVDEGVTSTWYLDADGDNYGDASSTTQACDLPSGYSADDSDCDDSDSSINRGAYELCDGVDNDCDGTTDETDAVDASSWYRDHDGDGYGDAAASTVACDQPTGYVTDATDCDDLDDDVFPGADEYCDGVDNDCDGDIDEEAVDGDDWFLDVDGDGYGDATSSTQDCDQPTGYVADDSDCDDADASINPAASEICDGVDNDCDGDVDDDDSSVTGASTWYVDYDGDGYGGALLSTDACEQPSNYVADSTDCDDSDASAHPGGTEVCDGADNDCDGTVDEDDATDVATWYADADGDGYGDPSTSDIGCDAPSGYVADATDCDDDDDAISPDAQETCDGVDNDCDGLIDDADTDYVGAGTWYADGDGDGYGDAASTSEACTAPSGYVVDATDCDDGDFAVNPGASEVCDEIDNDCDGDVDDDDSGVTGTSTWYVDYDGDGYGGVRLSRQACDQPSGYVADFTDCDDSDDTAHPGATELCDGVDNDCDGATDEADATDASTFYADADGDGYGDASSTDTACTAPAGYVADATDCDDADAGVNPGASEDCDGADNDCDGGVDEGLDSDGDGLADCYDSEECDGVDNDGDGDVDEDDAVDASTYYADADADGYGDPGSTTAACSEPSGYTADSSDCDDDNNTVYPGADELCDGLDNDCDGTVDDGALISWYADADGDGYGDASSTSEACSQPSGHVADADDCDDTDAAVSPAASELCDGVDNDCDGTVDEDDATDADTWYIDSDGDGFGSTSYTTAACDQPSGYVADATDCNDYDGDDHPGADETCDGVDNDCDGDVDEAAVDLATWYADSDGDGYGDASTSTDACEAPSGYVSDSADCDDGDADINPDAEDICDGVDNDCDGSTDPGGLDSDGDGLCNGVDPTVYSYDFDDGAWTDWSYVDLGGGNVPYWYMTGGYLYEASNAAKTIAYGPDLGELYTYSITVDTAFGGAATDLSAIVFGMTSVDEFWLARWSDPTDYYGSYDPPGQLSVQYCLSGTCTNMATDDGTVDLSVAYSTWSELSVTVDNDDVYVYLDGVLYVTYNGSGLAPLGADIVGVYSHDCDSGVYYDNFEVTNP